jgi:hypothetical protein
MRKEFTYELAQSYIRFDFKANDEFKTALEEYLLHKGKEYAKDFFNKDLVINEFFFTVETEDGSLKSRLKIFGTLLIGGLISYGGIRTGIDYLIQDARAITNHIVTDIANEPNIDPNSIGRVERRLGVPGQLKRLFQDIDNLNSNRNNLTETEQTALINKISSSYRNLINILDQPIIEQIQLEFREQEILYITEQNQLPLPNDDFDFPRLTAIREEDEGIFLIGEGEIDGEIKLPKPN